MTLSKLVFDDKQFVANRSRPGLWLGGAALLVLGYLLFGLTLQGVQGLSRGGFVFAAAGLLWAVVGLVTRQASFPPILALPLAFFVYTAVTGLQLSTYPLEYILQLFTVWMGAVSIALFLANGVSINVVFLGLVVLCAANFTAVALGFDTYKVNVQDFDAESLDGAEILRHSGLAGQTNKLVGLLFTLPFAVFLLRRRLGLVVYVVLVGLCLTTAVVTGSRTTLAFTTLFVLSGAVWLIGSGIARMLLLAAGLAGALILADFFGSDQALSRIENSSLGELVLVKRALRAVDGDDSSAETRAAFATDFWPYFNEQPFIGYGPERFGEITGADTYAHNNFVEIAINGGLVGLLLYYAMYGAIGLGIVSSLPRALPLLAPLAFLIVADGAFVTMLARGMVLLLCLCLVTVRFSVGSDGRRRRRRRRHGSVPV